MVRSTNPGSIFATASTRPMCVVTWMTRILGVASIIETSSVPESFASSSVCPGKACPPACSASLLRGAVQMAWIFFSFANSTARTMNW